MSEQNLKLQDIERTQNAQTGDKGTVSGYGVLTLPANATGRLQMGKSGLTLTNIVENGNFSDGTAGWNINVGISSFTVSDNVATVLANAQFGLLSQSIPRVIGHVYLTISSLKATSNETSFQYAGRCHHLSKDDCAYSTSILLSGTGIRFGDTTKKCAVLKPGGTGPETGAGQRPSGCQRVGASSGLHDKI